MITDQDINKLKEVFATRDDIKEIRKEMKLYVTKDDLREELKKYATKEDLKHEIRAVAQDTAKLIEMVGTVISKLDANISDHEKRLQKLENHVFS